jgi:hypothetical protein
MLSYLLDEFRHERALHAASRACLFMRTILLLVILILAPLACRADALADLYVGEAPVADQGGAERQRALPLALENVLQKLSGLRSFDDYALLNPALEQAPDLLLSYHYENAEMTLADGSETEELRLVARFAESAVDEMARALQLPLWQPQRQPLTAWLIIDDGQARRIMPVEFGYTQQSMEDVARRRGLPLQWPSPDADGAYSVDEQILWGGYTEDLAASRNEGVLIAAARREGPEWGLRINVGYLGQHWTWRLNDIDLQAALTEGVQQAVDQIAAVNTIAASDLGRWQQEVTVSGLGGAEDYRRCFNYFQSISVVEEVAVIAAQPGTVKFRLMLSALPRYLEEALEAGDVLERSAVAGRYVLLGMKPSDT